jgi:hypothetical protein
MDKQILQSSVRLKVGTGKYPATRGAILQEVKESLPLAEVEAGKAGTGTSPSPKRRQPAV